LSVYKVEDTTKEEFVANAVQVDMQHRHFYTTCHVTKVASATAVY